MKIPIWFALLGMAVVAAVGARGAPGEGRIPEMPGLDLPEPARPDDPRGMPFEQPESYLVFGVLPEEITAVTYDAWQFDRRFVVLRTLDAGAARPARREPEFKSQLGEITAVNFVSMRGSYFVPGVFKAAPMAARWDGSALVGWLADGVETYAPLAGGFRDSVRGERMLEGQRVLTAEVAYFSEKDGLEMRAVFAAWASEKSGNAYLLFAMTAPEFTPDDALDLVLKEILLLGDYIDVPLQGSGDPLKGLNVTSTGNSADGKTVEVDFDD